MCLSLLKFTEEFQMVSLGQFDKALFKRKAKKQFLSNDAAVNTIVSPDRILNNDCISFRTKAIQLSALWY